MIFVLSKGSVRDDSVTKSLCAEAVAIVTADTFAQLHETEGGHRKITSIMTEFQSSGLGGGSTKLGAVLYKVRKLN